MAPAERDPLRPDKGRWSVAASPTYKAIYTGLLKVFLDPLRQQRPSPHSGSTPS